MSRKSTKRPAAIVAILLVLQDLPASAQITNNFGDWQATFSGHARTMYESYHGLDFGLGPLDDDDWLHQRIQLGGTLSHGEELKLGAELTWGHMWGKESPLAPPDEDEPDILQAYAEILLPTASDDLRLKAGRQTLYYGSGRLLAAREGANQRLSHDALLLSWQPDKDRRVDAFIASPVRINPGTFDNISEPGDLRLWSLYSVMPLPRTEDIHFDLYYIGLRDDDSIFAPGGGHETRHTIGTRLWSKDGPEILNTEFIAQFGEAGGRDILAGAASLGIGYEFEDLPWHISPQLRADAISGGDEGGTIHTFHPLFQANNYFNEGGFLSPSNLFNLNPLVTLKPEDGLTFTLGVNFQWLASTQDAIYGPPLQKLGTPVPGGNRYLGTAFNASVEWEFAEGTSLFLGYTHHDAGKALTDIGGEDVEYLQGSFRWEF
ncbi:alginate export family protein [Luteolibacter luteus]|uniref:Alginate export family protein n=1 Tax=Luteolibacter luteus TaxID=2728835 RepID=A0A858REU5_9BACT|nr:alginate export family protein [Luteolibacter luteus]QJE95131.1 alginate export family protein [Luteolibacter luteus]